MPGNVNEWDQSLGLHQVEEKPKHPLVVTFGSVRVEKLGQILTPSQVKHCPSSIHWEGMDPNALYTFVFTDPDVPSREDPSIGEWHHYLVVNMKGNDLNSGCTLTQYVGSAPGRGTGLHRYIMLVYKQNWPLKCDEPILGDTSAENREKFKTQKFRQKYKLGPPVAGMCYLAEWDDTVPAIYKQLGAED